MAYQQRPPKWGTAAAHPNPLLHRVRLGKCADKQYIEPRLWADGDQWEGPLLAYAWVAWRSRISARACHDARGLGVTERLRLTHAQAVMPRLLSRRWRGILDH